ncbi:FAD-dependent oxidoreductase [Cytophaga sp. FL35]|uniref:FAD-dependent oxidoreductase n=1 Tax=Cytophaga sp. FL35 TaxID=1904456 RepID=UPI001653BC56|nr:FAD-dependent oxidoreductase [Cytophaga sp. FL35]MBC7000244.1 FAD-dependent oxidoreductase [Cytophaga sp. FL35]
MKSIRYYKKISRLLALTALTVLLVACKEEKTVVEENLFTADVIVYGGTSAAVTTAVQAKQMGKSVLVVSPDKHLGGLSSSGLGYTDTGNKEVIGGLAREFYQKIYQYYQKDETWQWQKKEEYGNVGQGTPAIDGTNRTMWIFEPHVAEQVFEDFITENDITVYREEFLDRSNGVTLNDGKITRIETLSGKKFGGKVFIDATYEGDLMAAAGVTYTVGREARETYNEEWNGVQVGILHHQHHFGDMNISPYKIPGDSSSGIVNGVSTEDPGKRWEADKRVQAYNFRMCLTKVEENRVPFEKPDGYNPENYELLARVYEAGWDQTFKKFDPIPNLKTDTNNHGPFSTDFIGMNYDYPEASYERRAEIIKEHENYQKGLLYFVATDERIPEEVQNEFKQWGLAKDEFEDNGHWPHQIYVREARRMIGDYVMTENDILGKREVPNSIGMGSYTMDSHNTQRYITPEGFVQNEGDIGVHAKEPYKIALGTILPKKEEVSNLIVPVAVSSSHIAFGSIRMEPVFMILGQSAAALAGLSIDQGKAVQEVAYADLQKELLQKEQRLEAPKKDK